MNQPDKTRCECCEKILGEEYTRTLDGVPLCYPCADGIIAAETKRMGFLPTKEEGAYIYYTADVKLMAVPKKSRQ